MYELRVCAYGDELSACCLEIFMLLCQSSELGCSDKGEISRIKEEDRPLPVRLQVRKADLSKVPS